MTIKYEPVFGDQSLFDDAPEDAEYAGWFCQETRWYMILNGKILFSDGGTWCTSDNPYLSADIAAMRRVIKTPTWTRADQEAGVLPPIGSKYLAGTCKIELECLYNDSRGNVWGFGSKGEVHGFAVNYCSPLETPEEKTKRLEDAFIKQFIETPATSIESAYALGLRDAYRKLKAQSND